MSDGAAGTLFFVILLLGCALGAAAGVWGWEAWGRETLRPSDEVTSDRRVTSVEADVAALDAKLDALCDRIGGGNRNGTIFGAGGCRTISGWSVSDGLFSQLDDILSRLNSIERELRFSR